HEAKQARATARMAELEREAYDELAARLAEHAARLRDTADALAEIDVLASLAQIAEEQHYVRPEILEEVETEIVGGRHPVVESALGWDAYIPNDVRLANQEDAPRVILLTGPNMAGKTTYGRMVLLVALLGQC